MNNELKVFYVKFSHTIYDEKVVRFAAKLKLEQFIQIILEKNFNEVLFLENPAGYLAERNIECPLQEFDICMIDSLPDVFTIDFAEKTYLEMLDTCDYYVELSFHGESKNDTTNSRQYVCVFNIDKKELKAVSHTSWVKRDSGNHGDQSCITSLKYEEDINTPIFKSNMSVYHNRKECLPYCSCFDILKDMDELVK